MNSVHIDNQPVERTGWPPSSDLGSRLSDRFYITDFVETDTPGQYKGQLNAKLDFSLFEYDTTYHLISFNVLDNYYNSHAQSVYIIGEHPSLGESFDVRYYVPEVDESEEETDQTEKESTPIKEKETGIQLIMDGFDESVEFVAKDASEVVENVPEVLGSNFALL